MNKNGALVLSANRVNDLFIFKTSNNQLYNSRTNINDALKWHDRLGHLNFQTIRFMLNNNLVRGPNIEIPRDISCLTCMKNKCTQKPYTSSENRTNKSLELIHSDVCGPMNNLSIGGAKYFLTFIDDKTRYVYVYFLKNKNEVFEKFKEFKLLVECQTENKIKILRSDNGTEYVNNSFKNYLKENGIIQQLTVPYTPQQNGVAERFNRTLVEMARCMINDADVQESIWAEAIHTAAYIRNRVPSNALDGTTPYEAWTGHKPSINHLQKFGSIAVALDKRYKGKFKPKGKQYLLVGYADNRKAYRLYDRETNKLVVSRDVSFIESNKEKEQDLILKNKIDVKTTAQFTIENEEEEINVTQPRTIDNNSSTEDGFETTEEFEEENSSNNFELDIAENSNNDTEEEENSNIENQERRRGPGRPRLIRTGNRGRPKKEFNMVNLICSEVPITVKDALNSKYADKWWEAMKSEHDALLKNETWEVTDLPKHQKIVGNKWVFALKKDKNGNIERFKARLVAKGYSQIYGLNYTETYSPVARYETIRMIFAIAAEYEMHLHQMDVTAAYLNSELDDEIYMFQPEKFVDKSNPKKVLKLKGTLWIETIWSPMEFYIGQNFKENGI